MTHCLANVPSYDSLLQKLLVTCFQSYSCCSASIVVHPYDQPQRHYTVPYTPLSPPPTLLAFRRAWPALNLAIQASVKSGSRSYRHVGSVRAYFPSRHPKGLARLGLLLSHLQGPAALNLPCWFLYHSQCDTMRDSAFLQSASW